jgi:predicted nuclease of predicted toxin-antitoxin system
VRLLLDEMFSPVLAQQLRERRHDVEAVKEHHSLISLPDPELFARAQMGEQAVVTENVADFMALHAHYAALGHVHHGLILTSNATFPRGHGATLGALVRALDELLSRPGLPSGATSHHEWLKRGA